VTERASNPHAAAEYAREDATLRGVWLASASLTDWRAIRDRAVCSDSDAIRVSLVRAFAAPELVSAWLDGRALTWRQLARIALVEAPGDPDGQRDAARRVATYRRFADGARPLASVTPLRKP
jgi:hypothetical protein